MLMYIIRSRARDGAGTEILSPSTPPALFSPILSMMLGWFFGIFLTSLCLLPLLPGLHPSTTGQWPRMGRSSAAGEGGWGALSPPDPAHL